MIKVKCIARYIELEDAIRCGKKDIPWFVKNDLLAEYEVDGMRKGGYCDHCTSRIKSLERKKCRPTLLEKH
jgi:hypothetical protein